MPPATERCVCSRLREKCVVYLAIGTAIVLALIGGLWIADRLHGRRLGDRHDGNASD